MLGVNVGDIKGHFLRKTSFDAFEDAGCRKNNVIKGKSLHSSACIIEKLHFGYTIFPSRVSSCVVVLIKIGVFEVVCRQYISQSILVFWYRTTESGDAAHFDAFSMVCPSGLHFEFDSTLCSRCFLYVGEQTKRLFCCATIAIIWSNNMGTIEDDFRTSWIFSEHVIVIACVQYVTIVRC